MNQQAYTDEQIVQMIRQAGIERKKALRFAYLSWRKSAKAIMVSAGIGVADAEDAIQEAIVIMDNSIRNGKYEPTGSLKNYFIGICKGRVYSNKRSTKRIDWTDDHLKMDGVEVQQPETLMLEQEQKSVLMTMLNLLDKKCQEVLHLYKLSYSMAEIASEADLTNSNNARQKVFSCRKRLVKLATKDPLFYNYFKHEI